MAPGFPSVDEPGDGIADSVEPAPHIAPPSPARSNHAPTRLAVAPPAASERDLAFEPGSVTNLDLTPAAEPARVVDAAAPGMLERDYRPSLDRLEHQWRTVVLAAQSEADTIRTNADRDARRIVADAQQERSLLLTRAAERLAVTNGEAERELARWVSDFDEEREAVLDAAHEEAERLLRAANLTAGERARARLEAAEDDARRILTRATSEADRMLGEVSGGTSASSVAADALAATPTTVPSAPAPPREPAPPTQATITPLSAPTASSPTAAAAPDPTTGAGEDPLIDGHRYWEDQFWGCQARPKPQAVDVGWLVVDGVSLTPRETPRSEALPPQVVDRPKVEWTTLVELVLSVLGILAAVLVLVWLWGP